MSFKYDIYQRSSMSLDMCAPMPDSKQRRRATTRHVVGHSGKAKIKDYAWDALSAVLGNLARVTGGSTGQPARVKEAAMPSDSSSAQQAKPSVTHTPMKDSDLRKNRGGRG